VKRRPALVSVLGVAAVPGLVAYALTAAALAQGRGQLSYAAASPTLTTLTVTAGLSLAAAGLIAGTVAPGVRVGGFAVGVAVLWFAPVWVGWFHGPGVIRGVAAVAAPLWLPAAVHLLLRCPDGRLASPTEWWLVRLGYAGTATVTIILALFRDPFFDVNCWADCDVSLFLVRSLPQIADAVGTFGVWFGAALTFSAAVLALRRVARAPARPAGWTPVPAALALAAASAGYAVARQRTPLESPDEAMFRLVYETRCAGSVLLAAAVLGCVGLAASRRRALAQLAQAPDPGDLEAALRTATGDPTLTVAYWLPVSQRFVDAQGCTVAPPDAAPGRVSTPLVRGDRRLAVVTHAAGVPALDRSLGGGVRLALENMVLRVEILAQLSDVQTSRTRIVAAADARRRALERDLHDGAQQDLAALLYRLRALARLASDPHLVRAAEIVERALDDLRSIAHGIYPAVLDHAGLKAALATLAETADVPVELDDDLPPRRYPALVERTAYLVVADAIAFAPQASHVAVSAREDEELLVITVPGLTDAQHVADRVGAARGRLVAADGVTRVELPCGS